jgi:integration host factor subunit beta
MTKSELTEALSLESNISKPTATSIVNTIIDSMTDALVKNENVELRGFGSFSVRLYDP